MSADDLKIGDVVGYSEKYLAELHGNAFVASQKFTVVVFSYDKTSVIAIPINAKYICKLRRLNVMLVKDNDNC